MFWYTFMYELIIINITQNKIKHDYLVLETSHMNFISSHIQIPNHDPPYSFRYIPIYGHGWSLYVQAQMGFVSIYALILEHMNGFRISFDPISICCPF